MRRSLINKYVAPSRCMLLPLLPQMAFDIINLLDFLYFSTFEVPEILWNCQRWFQPEWKLAYCRFFRINYRFVAVKLSPQKSLPRSFPADTRQSHHRILSHRRLSLFQFSLASSAAACVLKWLDHQKWCLCLLQAWEREHSAVPTTTETVSHKLRNMWNPIFNCSLTYPTPLWWCWNRKSLSPTVTI